MRFLFYLLQFDFLLSWLINCRRIKMKALMKSFLLKFPAFPAFSVFFFTSCFSRGRTKLADFENNWRRKNSLHFPFLNEMGRCIDTIETKFQGIVEVNWLICMVELKWLISLHWWSLLAERNWHVWLVNAVN